MPFDEKGDKWSCNPCLRGHRSSKCKHFDRLMAKVPKSGRPPKKCPHARHNGSCKKSYAVMAPLSHGSQLLCRLVRYVSDSSDDPYTSEPYSPTSLDSWHGIPQNSLCAQPPHVLNVLDIISEIPAPPVEDFSLSSITGVLDGAVFLGCHANAHPVGLGIDLLPGNDMMMPTSSNDMISFSQDPQLGIGSRDGYVGGYGLDAHAHMEARNLPTAPGFDSWSAVFGAAL
ncbi:copper fist DNA binding domain-containing protein [Aspergillus recurvatus]